jgi:hypothetical protein
VEGLINGQNFSDLLPAKQFCCRPGQLLIICAGGVGLRKSKMSSWRQGRKYTTLVSRVPEYVVVCSMPYPAIYSITKSQGQPKARSQSPAVLVSLAITPDQPPQPPHAGCCPSISVSASAPPWQRIQPPARRGTSSSSPKGTRSQALHQLPTPLSGPTILFVDRHVDMPPTQLVWC